DADSLFLLVDDYYNGQPISYSFKYDILHAAPSNETASPNDTRATADALPFNTTKNAYVGFNTPAGVDNEDYFKLVFPRNGTFKLYVTAQSMRDISATVLPQLYIYDRNGGAVSIFRNNNPSGFTYTQLGYGSAYNTITDTFNVYGRAADTMYISLSSYVGNWAATYSLNWSIADTALNNEPAPNETLTTANSLAEGQTINGDISYVGNGPDLDDYYRIVLAKEGTVTLYTSSINTWNQQVNPSPTFYVLDKNATAILVQNNAGAQSGSLTVRNTGSAPFLSTISDTMHVFGRAKDTFYIRVNSYHYGQGWAWAAHYSLRYQMTDTSANNELGPNETIATAQTITPSDTVRGSVSYIDGRSNADVDDYFRIVKPVGGAIVLYITGQNTWGYNSAYTGAPVVRVVDKNNNQFLVKSATGASGGNIRVRNNGSLAYGQSVSDTMVISCLTTDTVFLHLSNYINSTYGGVASRYKFRYELIPGPKSDFAYSRVGSEFGFVNNSKYADNYLWIMDNGSTYTSFAPPVINYTIPNAYSVKLVTLQGSCNYRDTAFANFTITGIEHYSPKSAGRGGDVALEIFGGGLDSTTAVTLKQGSTILTPTKKYTNGKKNFLTALMDLHSVPTGLYDVILTVPGMVPITYTNGFRVDSLKYPYAWSQVSGPYRWLVNRPSRFNLIVGNNGNVNASGVVAAIVWPKTAKLTWVKEDYKPSFMGTDTFTNLGKTYTVPRSAYQFIYDSVDMFTAIDSFEGKPYDGYIKYFQIPFIPANSTVSIPFDVVATASHLQKFYTFTHRPNIFGSCPNGNQEDMMNEMSGEALDYVDGFAEKTKMPLFQAFTKTAKVGQYHMRSAATYVGEEFWAWYDGYETDHNANQAAWIGRTEECNQAAMQTFAQEAGNALLGHAVASSKVLNDRVNYVNKLLANNPNLSPKTFDKAMDILNKSGKGLGNINYDRLKLLKDLYDKTKDLGDQSEKFAKLMELVNNCPELKDKQKELIDMLGGELDHNGGSESASNSVTSFDPNEIYGPQGIGTPGYLNSLQRQPFLVTFENVDTASAVAQTVVVLDTIDKSKFDINSLVLGDAVVGGQTFRVPQGRNEFMVQGSLNNIPSIKLRIVATTDTAKGIIRWQFTALDSATNNLPLLQGFLQPNINGVQGTASVSYTIKPSSTVIDGSILQSRASIVFDTNIPVATSTWLNTIDLLPPTSKVLSATQVYDSTILLRFSGADATSGIQKYKVFYATNGGAWQQFGDTREDSMLLTGQPDSSYSFYCVAIDNVENRELKAPIVEASIKMLPLGTSTTHSAGNIFQVFPNPASSKAFVRYEFAQGEEVNLRLLNLEGKEVMSLIVGKQSGVATIPINLTNIPAGIYLLEMKTGSGLRDRAKLVVLH
ncbi:MAG: T9SS type A sorting domain-containing protein, partial [Chitinophagaceae bacterium]